MIDAETIELIKATNPQHGLEKAIEIYLRIKEERKKTIPNKIDVIKYANWIVKKGETLLNEHAIH